MINMKTIQVGDSVRITATDHSLRTYSCNGCITTGSIHTVLEIDGDSLSIDEYAGWIQPSHAELVLPLVAAKPKKVPVKTIGKAKVVKITPKKSPTQYLASTKQAFMKEYIKLPMGPKTVYRAGGQRRVGVKALLTKYNIPKATAICGKNCWVAQYNNGGWDSTYAVGFTRKGNATMR